MSALVEVQESPRVWLPPPEMPLDEGAWDAWIAKRATQDRRRSDARLTAVKWVLIVGLLAAAALWSQIGQYEVAIKFAVTVGGAALLFQAIRRGNYAFAAVFGILIVLYNPLVSVLGFSGDWQRAVVAVSAAPFIASLAMRNGNGARHD